MTEHVYFAIGDIHGELDRLKQLEDAVADYASEVHPGCRLITVHLGDMIDRGPDSCGVIEHVMALQSQRPEDVIVLRGNHEQWMLDHCDNPDHASAEDWLRWGGRETLDSYRRRGMDGPPTDHIDWIAGLPTVHRDEARNLVFVHAGVDPARFPDCDPNVHLWSRKRTFFDVAAWTSDALAGQTVVHGHTPTSDREPDHVFHDGRRRINVDTGAVYGGPLSGVVLAPHAKPVFLKS